MTITRVKARSVWDLDADLYVETAEMVEWPRAIVTGPVGVNPWGAMSYKAVLQVLDPHGRDAGSELFDSATQDALSCLDVVLERCPFLTPRGRIAVAEVPGSGELDGDAWFDKPGRYICLACRET